MAIYLKGLHLFLFPVQDFLLQLTPAVGAGLLPGLSLPQLITPQCLWLHPLTTELALSCLRPSACMHTTLCHTMKQIDFLFLPIQSQWL